MSPLSPLGSPLGGSPLGSSPMFTKPGVLKRVRSPVQLVGPCGISDPELEVVGTCNAMFLPFYSFMQHRHAVLLAAIAIAMAIVGPCHGRCAARAVKLHSLNACSCRILAHWPAMEDTPT